ncbi:hypothetical protein K474DRAFT_1617887 [Panus rudis PR-1116 ss-1]|nr:hypothetical protein K474DRAFT_1617887 [Panus rudis PR-1116 ss-1]
MFKGLAELIVMDANTREEFVEKCKPGGEYDGVVAVYRRNFSALRIGNFDRGLIESLPKSVRWIAHVGAGYDKVDVQACIDRGITLSHTPHTPDDATATTAFFLMISAFRQFSRAERNLRAGAWKGGLNPGDAHDLTGRTLAILGLGGIGMRLVELAHAFPMRIVYHNRRRRTDAPEWCEYYPEERLDEMLGMADVLSISVPLRKETEGLVGEKMIRALKPGAILVNTARGRVVDEEAMLKALEDGHLGGIGLDVFPDEPDVNPRLLAIPNATLLPHVGTSTGDTLKKMELMAFQNIHDFLTKGRGENVVPEMA